MLSPDSFTGLESEIIGVTNKGIEMYTDLDALYLTELYELGCSKSLKSSLNQYKFILSWWLSEFGFNAESESYLDAIKQNISSDRLQELKKLGDICDTSTDR